MSLFKIASSYLVYDTFSRKNLNHLCPESETNKMCFHLEVSFIDIYTPHNFLATRLFLYSSHSFLYQRNLREDKKGLEVCETGGMFEVVSATFRILEGGQDHRMEGRDMGRQRVH